MITSKLDKTEMKEFYNVLSQGLFDQSGFELPFGGMRGILEPGQTSKSHAHHETEIFFILKGAGKISNETVNHEINLGDVFLSPPFENHWLKNEGNEDLVFISLWWDNEENKNLGLKTYLNKKQTQLEDKILITATPPTPNGDLHLGHLSGPFLNSDIIKRICQIKKVEAVNISGLDDNQNYVALKAQQLKTTPADIADSFGNLIKNTWTLGKIDYDYIIEPKGEEYKIFVDNFFRKLYTNGHLIEKETEVFYDENDHYIFEAFIKGNCPHCNEMSDGLACEQCGMPNDCVDLINPTNKIGEKLIKRKIKRLFLPMSKFEGVLEDFLGGINLTYRMKNLKDKFMEALPDIPVTHPTSWGINSSISGFESQAYYVWAEMAVGFLYASQQTENFQLDNPEKWDGLKTKFVQCFGFDNAYFYMFLFPALWKGYDENIKLPDRFITNEFLCLEGSKFSTSRNHAIWGSDILKKIDADLLRMYLSTISPVGKESNFVLDRFKQFSKILWEETFIPWISNINGRLSYHFNGEVPYTGAWTKEHVSYFNSLNETYSAIKESYSISNFVPKKMAELIFKLVSEAYDFSQKENELYCNDDFNNEQRTSINLELRSLHVFSIVVYPIMPDLARQLWKSFGLNIKEDETATLEANISLDLISYSPFSTDVIKENITKIDAL